MYYIVGDESNPGISTAVFQMNCGVDEQYLLNESAESIEI